MSRAYPKTESSSSRKSAPVACPLCGGCGWRPVIFRGSPRMMRCTHRVASTLVPRVLSAEVPDFKTQAAGER